MTHLAPKCHKCTGYVVVWQSQEPQKAVCVDCCETTDHGDGEKGHKFSYDRHEGWVCDYCGGPPTADFWRWLEDTDD